MKYSATLPIFDSRKDLGKKLEGMEKNEKNSVLERLFFYYANKVLDYMKPVIKNKNLYGSYKRNLKQMFIVAEVADNFIDRIENGKAVKKFYNQLLEMDENITRNYLRNNSLSIEEEPDWNSELRELFQEYG